LATQRERYFNTLGFTPNDAQKRKDALGRAYQLRSFEIEHYWKRATYFWGFQIAIFAAVGFVWKDLSESATSWAPIAVALSGIGVLTATANYLSARGSKFWQENWEKHIDMLEDDIEGRLHKTVWLSSGHAEFSVSRVNQRLGSILILFWFVVTLYLAQIFIGWPSLTFWSDIPAWCQFMAIVAVIVVSETLLVCQKTSFDSTIPNEKGEHGTQFKQWSCWSRSSRQALLFIRRRAPYE
jgi:hypothetical protein